MKFKLSNLFFVFTIAPIFLMAQKNDKVDLKQIEEQFWSAKDTDFAVVQNRAFPKEKRFFISASTGTLMNDPFVNSTITRYSFGYFFSERWGFEIANEDFASSDNKATQYFKSQNQYPNYNLLKNYKSISLTWVPFYAKMSFLDRMILYFDMQLNVGGGIKSYESYQQNTTNVSDTTTGFHFDISQNIFFSRNFALRMDIKNQWSTQNRMRSINSATLEPELTNDTSLLFGINFFF